jgi:hypothetical protein
MSDGLLLEEGNTGFRFVIFWLGRRVAAGMSVAEDQAGTCADDGGTEDLSGAQHRVVGCP